MSRWVLITPEGSRNLTFEEARKYKDDESLAWRMPSNLDRELDKEEINRLREEDLAVLHAN